MNVGQHTTLGDGNASEQLAQLLVIAHSQLDVAGNDARLLVVAGSISCQLQHLSCKVFQHGSQIHRGPGTNALCREAGEAWLGGVLLLMTDNNMDRLRQCNPNPAIKGCCILSRRASSTHTLTGIAALLQVPGNAAHRELEASLAALAHGLLAGFSFSTARHLGLVGLGGAVTGG
jgi:hypothetical protein